MSNLPISGYFSKVLRHNRSSINHKTHLAYQIAGTSTWLSLDKRVYKTTDPFFSCKHKNLTWKCVCDLEKMKILSFLLATAALAKKKETIIVGKFWRREVKGRLQVKGRRQVKGRDCF